MSGFMSFFNQSKEAFHSLTGMGGLSPPPVESLGDSLVANGLSYGFGGLMAYGLGRYGFQSMTELRNLLFWVAIGLVFLLFAATTKPTEASFRAHLTELSFRRHLADMRSDNSTAAEDAPLPSHTPTPEKADKSAANGTDTPTIAPFRFANHVAISLRTPTLLYKTLFFLSLAFTSPLGPPTYLSDPISIGKGKQAALPREPSVIYLGFMGHWSLIGVVPSHLDCLWKLFTGYGREKGKRKGVALDRPGIIELRAVSVKEESSIPSTKPSTILPPIKLLRKSESTKDPLDPSLSLHPHSTSMPTTSSDSRKGSSVPGKPFLAEDTSPSPLVIGLKVDLVSAQSALADIKSQLHLHEQSVFDAHANLQATLDELRTRRKEDDAERSELKTRTKSMEEQKRQAEAARREGEKKLRAAESLRDALQAKIGLARNEIEDLKGNMEVSEKNARIVQEEGAKHVVETQGEVEGKRKALCGMESEVTELESTNEELGKQVSQAELKLKAVVEYRENQRKVAPEEEMMMMAAAYEAAAQEGYLHGYQGHGTMWANQAAAYMAEAGMPYLDQSYTAKSTTPGKQVAPVDPADRRTTGNLDFEDSGFAPMPMTVETVRSSTPPASENESDIYGPDPGSPNGGISSSFSANLLPQGLFRSLEGDSTPLDIDDEMPSSLQEALRFEPNRLAREEEHPDSGSESGDDHWPSPFVPPGLVNGKRLSGSRLLPPSTTPPGLGTIAPVIPGLPALAGSRRWFSGTGSSENVNAYSFLHPTGLTSNDSLNLQPYEASPFAPSASEKKALALKWGPLSKYPWVKRNPSEPPNASASDLPVPGTSGSNWLASRFASNGHVQPPAPPAIIAEQGEDESEDKGDKRPFRFFSLRKPSSREI